jgi:hypothetical protein
MMELRFKASQALFVARLQDWTRRRFYQWQSEDGGKVWAISHAELAPSFDGRTRVVMPGSVTVGADADNSQTWLLPELAALYVTRIDDNPERLLVELEPKTDGPLQGFYIELLTEIARNWPDALPKVLPTQPTPEDVAKKVKAQRRPGGRPPMKERDPKEYQHYLRMAMAARKYKSRDGEATWQQVARAIRWDRGLGKSGLKTLQRACDMLDAATPEDLAALENLGQ